MKLDEYLVALRKCPDEQVEIAERFCFGVENEIRYRMVDVLTAEFGVYDNFPILLKSDFNQVMEDFNNLGFTVVPSPTNAKGYAHYNDRPVSVQSWDYVFDSFVVTSKRISEEHHDRQLKNYSIIMMLHPSRKHRIDTRNLAIVIDHIGTYAMDNYLPLCFPRSGGWKNREDVSKIVYFP